MAFVPLPTLQPHRQTSVFEVSCTRCIAWEYCGGDSSAPCTCIHTGPEKRYNCAECNVICQERYVASETLASPDSFWAHIDRGCSLDALSLEQPSRIPFPVLIPTRTAELQAGTQLDLAYAGVSTSYLFNRNSTLLDARPFYETPEKARYGLRLSDTTRLIAVFNGSDEKLERFWGANRESLYQTYTDTGFGIATAPTCSVYFEHLASQNVVMMRRHNRYLSEMARHFDTVVPNIYWKDYRDRVKWVEWLKMNPRVSILSREFGISIKEKRFDEHLAGLVEIIKGSGRTFHVLLVSVGMATAAKALHHLDEIGCTASIITSDPIMEATLHRKAFHDDGGMRLHKVKNETPVTQLAINNLRVADQFLTRLTQKLSVYENRDWSNMRAGVEGEFPQHNSLKKKPKSIRSAAINSIGVNRVESAKTRIG